MDPNEMPDAIDGQERLDASAGLGGAKFVPSTYDEKNHTVDVVMYSGERVPRWYGFLELDTSPQAMDLSRVSSGKVHVFDSHNTDSIRNIAGNVMGVRRDQAGPVAKIRFAATPLGKLAEGMVSRGELNGASMGFSITSRQKISKEEDAVPVYRAVKWQLHELSLTGIPAAASAGALSAVESPGSISTTERTQPMAEEAESAAAETARQEALKAHRSEVLAEERKRRRTIVERTKGAGLPVEVADKLIDDGVEVAHIGDKLVDELAARGSQTAHRGAQILVDYTDPAVIRERMASALAALGTKDMPAGQRVEMAAEARQYAGLGMLDMFADLAEARGAKIDRSLRRAQFRNRLYDEVFALSSSDYPLLLADAANKVLIPAYNLAAPTFFKIARKETFTDFKAHHFLRAGDFPNLIQVGESGEITEGSLSEADATVTALTYGRTVTVTRRLIVNDDLSAFAQIPALAGRRTAQVVNTLGYNLFALNSGAGPDITESGTATHMWDATTHANYTSSGTAISQASIGVGRAAMRKQKSLDGMTIDAMPRYLVTGPDQESLARQFASSQYNPTQPSQINPWAGTFEPVIDANLTSTPWYFFADPADNAVFIYGYVAGYEGPRMMTQQGFHTDGVSLRVTLDFGCGGVDFRGTYKNAGA